MNEKERMARRVIITRVANNIRNYAKKISDDPENITRLLPQLKEYVRLLEEQERKR